MATVTISKRPDGVVNGACAAFTSDNAAQIVALGFNPSYVYVINETDVITWEKLGNQAAANSMKTVGSTGVTTLDTGSAIVLNGDGTITLSATLVGNAKAIKLIARA